MPAPQISPNFIPKKKDARVTRRKRVTYNIFLGVATALLVAALGAWGWFLYDERRLLAEQEELNQKLKDTHSDTQENPQLVEELEELDRRLRVADKLLRTHLDTGPLFDALEANTLTNSVRFSNFGFGKGDEQNTEENIDALTVSLSGFADSFASLRYQQQVLREADAFIGVEISNLSIERATGDVNYDLQLTIDPEIVSYMARFGESAREEAESDEEPREEGSENDLIQSE